MFSPVVVTFWFNMIHARSIWLATFFSTLCLRLWIAVRFKECRMLAVTQFWCTGKQIKRANVTRKGKKERILTNWKLERKQEYRGLLFPFPLPSSSFRSFSFSRHSFGILKLINYSCSQKPINDDHLAQVNESWHLMKNQIKRHQQLFIRDETFFFHLRPNTCICISMSKTRASCFITRDEALA